LTKLAQAVSPSDDIASPSGAAGGEPAGGTPPSGVIAEFNDFPSLHAALRQVQAHRNVSLECLDELVGTSKGYFSKVFSPNGQRRITMTSLGWALNGLGVRCLVVDDPAMLKQIESRLRKRDGTVVRSGARHVILSLRMLRKIGQKGGLAYVANHSPRQRSQNARKAAMARWHGRANTNG
jgi:hypothetical protein